MFPYEVQQLGTSTKKVKATDANIRDSPNVVSVFSDHAPVSDTCSREYNRQGGTSSLQQSVEVSGTGSSTRYPMHLEQPSRFCTSALPPPSSAQDHQGRVFHAAPVDH